MRKAMIYSTALHTAVIAVAYFGVPSLFRPPPREAPPIAVELVMEPSPEPPKPKAPAPKPRPPRAKAPPAAPDIPPPPQIALAKPEPPPPPPKAKRKPKPKPKPKPKAKPKPKPKPVKKVAAPRPRPRPKPPVAKPKAKRKPKPDQFQALLKNLAKQKVARTRERKQAALPVKPIRPRPTPRRAAIETRRLEQALILAVRQQLSPCWNIPAGAKDAQAMQVGIRIRLSPDGALRGAPLVLDTARMAADPFYRAVAESAVRALLNPDCRPLKLPLDQYDIWKEITFNFDPGAALSP